MHECAATMDQYISYMSPIGYQYNSCGYCGSRSDPSSASYYASSNRSVQPVHYKELVDRGWRRSGTTYYKPDVRHSCCPHYTIRLDANAFRPTKAQRKSVNRFNKYVLGQNYIDQVAQLCPKTRQQKKRRKSHFDLCAVIHEAEYSNIKRPADRKTQKPIQPAHKLEINLEPDKLTDEKYALFENYQRVVHKEPPGSISKSSFRSFLCSGIGQSSVDQDGMQRKLGSYHHCYRLDGRLVAMGVWDLLPGCVSSVYLMYHESVSDWEFGKLSALHEIAYTLEGGYGHYYMGFYVHSCIKMRYKATFSPTFVLDPETYDWGPLDKDYLARLSARRYVSNSRDRRLGILASTNSSKDDETSGKNDAAPELELEPSAGRLPDDVDYLNGDNHGAVSEYDKASAFRNNMPGVMTVAQVEEQVSLEDLEIQVGSMRLNLADALGEWDSEEMGDCRTLQGVVAEFVACIGPELAGKIVMDMSRMVRF